MFSFFKKKRSKKEWVTHITQDVNSRISKKEVALQFVLEELDAARQGSDEAIDFVENSGFTEKQYAGAMNNSFEEVDGINGPQQALLNHIFSLPYPMEENVSIRIAVVKNIISLWNISPKSSDESRDCSNLELSELVEKAENYFRNKDYKASRIYCEQAINSDEPIISYMLGFMYLNGLDIQKDVNIAKNYFEMSADMGNGYAHYMLSKIYVEECGMNKGNMKRSYAHLLVARSLEPDDVTIVSLQEALMPEIAKDSVALMEAQDYADELIAKIRL